MSLHHAAYKDVSRDVFNAVADRIRADKELDIPITIYYNGTALYGDVTIKGRGGASKEFKKHLAFLTKNTVNKILKVRVLTGALSFCLEGATNEIPLHKANRIFINVWTALRM